MRPGIRRALPRLGISLLIAGFILQIYVLTYPSSFSDVSVPVIKPSSQPTNGLLFVTDTSILAGQTFHGNLIIMNVLSLSGTSFAVVVSTEDQFTSWNQVNGGYPPSVYKAGSYYQFEPNWIYFAKPQQLVFPIDLLANSSAKYYFLFQGNLNYQSAVLTLFVNRGGWLTYTPSVLGLMSGLVLFFFPRRESK